MDDSEVREPSVAWRRAPRAIEQAGVGGLTGDLCHPSLSAEHRYLAFPATGREAVPYFAGYMSSISVAHGEPLSAHVATRSRQDCFIDLYRVVGVEDARLVPKLSLVVRLGPYEPHRLPPSHGGRRLSSGDADAAGCEWPRAELLPAVPDDWRSGIYLAQFTSADTPQGRASARAGGDALFIVRNGGGRGAAPLLYQVGVATWAAYHMWHNRSLYMGRTAEGERWDELRNSTASLRRPALGLTLPNETILSPAPPKAAYAFALVEWLEREGLEVDFCSGLDIGAGRVELERYRAVLTVGHDEYWTADQHEALQRYRASGGHTVFLGGNLAYWQVRAAPDLASIECYKNSHDPADNERGDGGELLDPRLTAVPAAGPPLTGEAWRVRDGSTTPTTGVYNHTRRPARPEEVVTAGGMWWWEEVGGPSRPACGFTVCEPDHWAFEGLQIAQGEVVGAASKLIGHEADGLEVALCEGRYELTLEDGALPDTELLAVADCRAWGEWDFGGWPPTVEPGRRVSFAGLGGFVTMVCRRAPGEGMIFCAPTTEWVLGLVPSIDWTATRSLAAPVLPADPNVARITRNVLAACLEEPGQAPGAGSRRDR
jgi:hypothetical protein